VGAAFRIAARVPMYKKGEPAARSLAQGIEGLAAAYRRVGADLVMVLGDRLEMLAAASAALAQRIPIAHVHGGETAPGIWDEQIRHAITKMAHVHFCATRTASGRIARMGEDARRIHVVGAPALDLAAALVRNARRNIPQIRLVAGTLPLLLLHPSSPDDKLEYRRTSMLIDLLLKEFPHPVLLAVGPNNDPGHRGILRAYAERHDTVHVEMSLTQQAFWWRMISSGLLVGNSSSGIIEAATLAIPVINLGNRQAGRERSGNVIDVAWEAGEKGIERAIQYTLTDKAFRRRVASRRNVYGDGNAAKRIIRVLEQIARHGGLPLEKRFHD
jgi:UDP-hydrolysing UDP-N-acetyl-D-glucosamine 2-epimerase